MLNLLLLLLGWVLWTSILAGGLWLTGRYGQALQRASWFAPLLLLLSLLPFLPWPQQALVLPSFWLAAYDHGLSPVLALPTHPAWLEQQHLTALMPDLALSLLLAGGVVSAALTVRQWRSWQQLQQLALPVPAQQLQPLLVQDPALAHVFADCAPQLRQWVHGGSPFVSGIRRSQLWLPAWFWQLALPQQQLLLWHELRHLQRYDPLWLMAWRVLCTCCWFNPALRLLERHFRVAMEHAVDQWVLRRQPSARHLYARTLLTVVRHQQSGPSEPWVQAYAGSGPAQELHHRLQQILKPARGLPLWQLALVFAVLTSLSVPALVLKTELTGLAPKQWQLPLHAARVSSLFGEVHSFRQMKPHGGIDFVAPQGTAVLAVAAGKVLIADAVSLNPNLGNVVLLDHGGGYQTMFAHLDAIQVQPGQQVKAGDSIGTLGNSGRTTGPHLHLELLQGSTRLDPALFLPLSQLQGATGE